MFTLPSPAHTSWLAVLLKTALISPPLKPHIPHGAYKFLSLQHIKMIRHYQSLSKITSSTLFSLSIFLIIKYLKISSVLSLYCIFSFTFVPAVSSPPSPHFLSRQHLIFFTKPHSISVSPLRFSFILASGGNCSLSLRLSFPSNC